MQKLCLHSAQPQKGHLQGSGTIMEDGIARDKNQMSRRCKRLSSCHVRCTHELSLFDCTRSIQDEVSQHANVSGEGLMSPHSQLRGS